MRTILTIIFTTISLCASLLAVELPVLDEEIIEPEVSLVLRDRRSDKYSSLVSVTGNFVLDKRESSGTAAGVELSGVFLLINGSVKYSDWESSRPHAENIDNFRGYVGWGTHLLQFQYGYGSRDSQSFRLKSEVALRGFWGDSFLYRSRTRSWHDRFVLSTYVETYFPDIQYGIGLGVHLWSPD